MKPLIALLLPALVLAGCATYAYGPPPRYGYGPGPYAYGDGYYAPRGTYRHYEPRYRSYYDPPVYRYRYD